MEDTELFQIGDVAKLFHLSVGTLRHYEKCGFLKPEYIDENTGYRYYSVRQFEVLTNIRYLRALDMPLDEIADFINNRDIEVIEEKLKNQKKIIAEKKKELEKIERKIDHRIEQIEDAVKSELNKIRLVSVSEQRIVFIRDNIKWSSYLSLEHSIRQLEKKQKTPVTYQGKVGVGISKENLESCIFGHYEIVFVILDKEDDYDGEVEIQPKGLFVTVRFNGIHADAEKYYKMLIEYIKANNLEITGFSRELTLIDNVITNDESKFVTEISIPVKEKTLGFCSKYHTSL